MIEMPINILNNLLKIATQEAQDVALIEKGLGLQQEAVTPPSLATTEKAERLQQQQSPEYQKKYLSIFLLIVGIVLLFVAFV